MQHLIRTKTAIRLAYLTFISGLAFMYAIMTASLLNIIWNNPILLLGAVVLAAVGIWALLPDFKKEPPLGHT